MTAFWMCELSPTDAFNRNQLLCREQLIRSRSRPEERPAIPATRSLQVLVVGDQQAAADELARRVHRWGHAVRLAGNVAAALKVAAYQQPDVVLLDLSAPLANAYLAAQKLRRLLPPSKCFIIATTADRPSDEAPEQCSRAGIDLLLMRPVDPSVIETLLLLERKRVLRLQADAPAGAVDDDAPDFEFEQPLRDERDQFAKHWRPSTTKAKSNGQPPQPPPGDDEFVALVVSRMDRETASAEKKDGLPPASLDSVLKIIVLEIAAGKVKQGFEVAGDLPIHRLELCEQIYAESAPAGGS